MNILFNIKVKIFKFINDHLDSPIMLTIKLKMINNFLAYSLIFYIHMMLFLCPFLDPCLTTHHSYYKCMIKENTKQAKLIYFICKPCSVNDSSGQQSNKSNHHE